VREFCNCDSELAP